MTDTAAQTAEAAGTSPPGSVPPGSVPAGTVPAGSSPGESAMPEPTAAARRTASGPGRLLVAVYAVFAVAATSRALVQIITKFDEARVAYLLSALAGVVYILATVGLTRSSAVGRRLATAACAAELVGVLTVGTLSVVDRDLFPDEAVWSGYGQGYYFLPVVLPVLGLWWLRHTAHAVAPEAA